MGTRREPRRRGCRRARRKDIMEALLAVGKALGRGSNEGFGAAHKWLLVQFPSVVVEHPKAQVSVGPDNKKRVHD